MTEKGRKAATIFIAFAQADTAVAHSLAEALHGKGLATVLDDQIIEPGERWADRLRCEFSTVDFVLFLVSARFLSSVWAHQSTSESFAQAKRVMSTAFVAAALDDSALRSNLNELICLDLRNASAARCDDIAARFKAVADINLHTLSAPKFERLVLKLFEHRGFEAVDTSGQRDQWWDFFLRFRDKRSIDSAASYKVFVECKYYAHQRPSVRELSELYAQAKALPSDCRALLATNTRLTSVARDWLVRHERESEGEGRVDVLEGPELTRMLLSDPAMGEYLQATPRVEDDHDS